MTTAIDTNVLIALWDQDTSLSAAAESALESALRAGGLVLSAPVFSELMAAPGRDERFLDAFLRDTGIAVDWNLDSAMWRCAGKAYQAYAAGRTRQREAAPRRILADFLIGAHALRRGFRLLTLEGHIYQLAFPSLSIARL